MLCERCLAMAFTFRKPSTACQITDFNLSGYRAHSGGTSASCPLYPQKRTLGFTREMSALCQKQTSAASLDHLVSKGSRILRLMRRSTAACDTVPETNRT